MNREHWSAPRATISLVLVRLGEMSGVVRWKGTGCLGGIGRAGQVEVRKRLDCTACTVSDNVAECLWVGIRGMESEGNVVSATDHPASM